MFHAMWRGAAHRDGIRLQMVEQRPGSVRYSGGEWIRAGSNQSFGFSV